MLGAPVFDPWSPAHQLLREGAVLDASLLSSLGRRGISQLWIEDDLTADLSAMITPGLTGARLEVFNCLSSDLGEISRSTITTASVQRYRQAVMELVTQAISASAYASMTDTLFSGSTGGLAAHSTNVAYLSVLTGLHAETYVVSEQPRLARADAREMSVLGMAGLMHDIGKAADEREASRLHEVHLPAGAEPSTEYRGHCRVGHTMLSAARAPARVSHAVLNHHQRYDGTGWPTLSALSGGRLTGTLAGKRIHVFARIVAAANLLDNLLRTADGARRPPVAALSDFASSRYDGWLDPVIRRALLVRVPPFAIGTEVRLSDGRRAVVVCPSRTDPCRPAVRILADADGRRPTEAIGVDLAGAPDLRITHAVGVDVTPFLFDAPKAGALASAA